MSGSIRPFISSWRKRARRIALESEALESDYPILSEPPEDRAEPERPFPWRRALTGLLAGAIALAFVWRVRDVLPPFLIAFFLASLLDPIVTKLQRRGVSRVRAVLTIYVLVFLVIVLVAARVIPAVLAEGTDLKKNLDSYSRRFTVTANSLYEANKGTLAMFGVKQNPLGGQSDLVARATATALDAVRAAVMGFAGKVIWLVIIPLSLFYFLMDFQALRRRLISFAPSRHQSHFDRISSEIVEVFSAYMRSLAVVCALYGICAVLIFTLLGLRFSLFLGVGAGVLYAVPYLGPAVAIGGAGAIAFSAENPTLGFTGIHLSPTAYAGVVVFLMVAMQLLFDYGLTPRVVGGSVGLHPIVNIFALMCGAALFGVWGMLLAVPVAASVQIVLIYLYPQLTAPLPPIAADSTEAAASPPAGAGEEAAVTRAVTQV